MPRLTKELTEATPVTKKHQYVWDDQLAGFGLRILPSGNKTFIVQYRFGKRIRKLIIGRFPIVSAKVARGEAMNVLNEVRSGRDPMVQKLVRKNVTTVNELAMRYEDEYGAAHQKPKTRRNNKYALGKHILPNLGTLNIRDINRTDIADLHLRLSKTPIMANQTLGILSKMFSLAELWGLRDEGTNPCRRIKKYAGNKRERYLTYDEVTVLGNLLQEHKHYPDENVAAIYCLQMLMLTGCRVGEILTMEVHRFRPEADFLA